jgi:hypothetical protein
MKPFRKTTKPPTWQQPKKPIQTTHQLPPFQTIKVLFMINLKQNLKINKHQIIQIQNIQLIKKILVKIILIKSNHLFKSFKMIHLNNL